MTATFRILLSIGVASALLGCAAGTDFVRPASQDFRNGATTYAEVVAKMGAPSQEGTLVQNNAKLKTASYTYVSLGGQPHRPGVTPARGINFVFHDDLLVAHQFMSSWATHHTDFDEGKAASIVKGRTTETEVIRLLGWPAGHYIYPMVKHRAGRAVAYSYSEMTGFKPYTKVLLVTFDSAGVVEDLEFSSQGEEPAARAQRGSGTPKPGTSASSLTPGASEDGKGSAGARAGCHRTPGGIWLGC